MEKPKQIKTNYTYDSKTKVEKKVPKNYRRENSFYILWRKTLY